MPAMKTQTVPALDRALSILELLANSRCGLSLPEIVDQSGLPRSTAHYLVVTLERRGYVQRNERTTRYMFGTAMVRVANCAVAGLSLRSQASPFLQALARSTGLTAHLGILSDNECVLIARQDPPAGNTVATWIGKRMAVHCTALGKALGSSLSRPELEALLQAHPLLRHNDNTISNRRKLFDELARVSRLGYAIDNEEEEVGSRCIGVPVAYSDAGVPTAISVAGTSAEIPEERLPDLIREVMQVARQLGPALWPASL